MAGTEPAPVFADPLDFVDQGVIYCVAGVSAEPTSAPVVEAVDGS
jgi:hypothetical protein